VMAAQPDASGAFLLSGVVGLAELEMRYIAWAEARMSVDTATLANLLGVSQRTLYRKLKDLREY